MNRLNTTELARHIATLGRPWRTRFAPAPTGWLHLGHAVNAVWVWGVARAFGGRVLLRVEDHDRGRCRPEYEQGLLDDLEWLGFEPDEGSLPSFRHGRSPYRQSDQAIVYQDGLKRLERAGRAYPCQCSRRDIAAIVGDVSNRETPYPGTCRTASHDTAQVLARRVRLDPAPECFEDLRLGTQEQVPAQQCGDVLVRDRHGDYTYQWCVVVDDDRQQVDIVIRGEDLLESTGRQIALARLIGRDVPPRFLHHPLVLRPDGAKLSKAGHDTGLREMRAAGVSPENVIGLAAHASGLLEKPQSLRAVDLASLVAERAPAAAFPILRTGS
jgi:glutamyl/glutaminyl-tRNA synthetase